MHLKTSKYIMYLQGFIKQNIKSWREQYPDIIKGVHIGKKEKGGHTKRYYSIVFHVRKKLKDLPPSKLLPKYFEINVPTRGIIKIPVDVIETGEKELNIFIIGDKVSEVGDHGYGTLGTFVYRGDDIYLLSNMHVIGYSLTKNGIQSHRISRSDQNFDVMAWGGDSIQPLACFEYGLINDYVDAAIAFIPNTDDIDNDIGGKGPPRGTKTLRIHDADNYHVIMEGGRSGCRHGYISATGAIVDLPAPNGSHVMFDLLRITPRITQKGDSGALVHDSDLNAIGLIVGADNLASYAIPIDTILNSLNVKLLTH